MKFRKKPIIITAMRLSDPHTTEEVSDWCGGKVCGVGDVEWIEIETLEGTMKANYGDYIIRGIKGEFYPCKPDIFESSYEPAE